jgi:low affinity Fe/Cu permease
MKELFHRFSQRVSNIVGSPWAFALAILIILIWGVTGPFFGYSNTWQLIINTGTTIITFLMVFLIQNTQNRDAKVIHLKLDELIFVTVNARNSLIDLEDLADSEIQILEKEYKLIQKKYLAEKLAEKSQV